MNRYSKIKNFHGSRLLSVGSSDIPILAGFGKQYGDTPYTLYLEKTGQRERRQAGPRAEWGHRLEPLILSAWIARNHGQEPALDYMAAAIRGRSSGPYKTLTEARMKDRPYVLAQCSCHHFEYHNRDVLPYVEFMGTVEQLDWMKRARTKTIKYSQELLRTIVKLCLDDNLDELTRLIESKIEEEE